MASKAAEESFRKGLAAFKKSGPSREAMALFEAAVTLSARAKDGAAGARYRSYYGLCLALEKGKYRDALTLCRKAAQEEFYNPDIWLNLGRVAMEAGNRDEAHEAFLRGFRLAPQNREFLRLLEILGRRRKPFFSFLARRHPLNVMLGRLTYRMSGKQDDD